MKQREQKGIGESYPYQVSFLRSVEEHNAIQQWLQPWENLGRSTASLSHWLLPAAGCLCEPPYKILIHRPSQHPRLSTGAGWRCASQGRRWEMAVAPGAGCAWPWGSWLCPSWPPTARCPLSLLLGSWRQCCFCMAWLPAPQHQACHQHQPAATVHPPLH